MTLQKTRHMAYMLAVLLLCGMACAAAENRGGGSFDVTYDPDAFRGIAWDMTAEQVQAEEQGSIRAGAAAIQVPGDGLLLYGLPVSALEYRFAMDGMLGERVFTLRQNTADALSGVFYALSLRYGMPVSATQQSAVWAFGGITITAQLTEKLTVHYALG